MTTHKITFRIDDGEIERWDDQYLALMWHAAQANPADGFCDRELRDLAESIGREIIP